ncbi:uncharacterized protein [Solanum lycopersicum]|uniref:uncharacterized protein n=1 Tax=Solanum lycopersicum TaxID=4081 RepID=UPI0037499D2D
MITRRNNARRVGEENLNEAIPPHAPQNPQVPIEEGDMSNVEIRSSIHSFNQVLATQVVRDAMVQVKPNTNITTSRIRDFTRMNPPTFYGIKVDKDPQGFIDELFQVLDSMGISGLVVTECRSAVLIPNMDISRLMVHAEQIKEQKLKQVGRDLKKVRTEERNSSNNRFEVQDKPRFKRRFSNQEPPNAPRKHDGKCLVGTGDFYGCGKSGHMNRDGPMMNTQGRESSEAYVSAPNLDDPKKNRFYDLQTRTDQRAHRTWSLI